MWIKNKEIGQRRTGIWQTANGELACGELACDKLVNDELAWGKLVNGELTYGWQVNGELICGDWKKATQLSTSIPFFESEHNWRWKKNLENLVWRKTIEISTTPMRCYCSLEIQKPENIDSITKDTKGSLNGNLANLWSETEWTMNIADGRWKLGKKSWSSDDDGEGCQSNVKSFNQNWWKIQKFKSWKRSAYIKLSHIIYFWC